MTTKPSKITQKKQDLPRRNFSTQPQKTERGQYTTIWSKRELFQSYAGPTREIPSEENGPILPTRVANQNTGLASSFRFADSVI